MGFHGLGSWSASTIDVFTKSSPSAARRSWNLSSDGAFMMTAMESVTAVSNGLVYLSAKNEGATSVVSIEVSGPDPLTTVVGSRSPANMAGIMSTMLSSGSSASR